MTKLRGSCLCGGVRYEISGPLVGPGNCHCTMCRKQHGAAFRSRARVQLADFHWVQGEDLVKFYESSPGTRRGFCSVCGSPMVNRVATNSVSGGFNPAGATEMIGIRCRAWTTTPGVTAVPCFCCGQGALVHDHRRPASVRHAASALIPEHRENREPGWLGGRRGTWSRSPATTGRSPSWASTNLSAACAVSLDPKLRPKEVDSCRPPSCLCV